MHMMSQERLATSRSIPAETVNHDETAERRKAEWCGANAFAPKPVAALFDDGDGRWITLINDVPNRSKPARPMGMDGCHSDRCQPFPALDRRSPRRADLKVVGRHVGKA